MKANELRIGNWVLNKNGRHIQVNRDMLGVGPLLDPIPLTPEILEKCNATKNHRYNTYMFEQFCVHEENGEFHLMNNEYSNASCYHICNVKYLHQLQNQIFSLTGED